MHIIAVVLYTAACKGMPPSYYSCQQAQMWKDHETLETTFHELK